MESLSGSKLPIARHCRWWLRPDVAYPKRERTQAASSGVRMHDAFASYVENGVMPPLTPSQRILAEHMKRFWGERKLARGWEAEVSYALDAPGRSARVLGKNLNRNYGQLRGGEIPLTVDYCWIASGVPVVGDWKTGFAAHVEPPEENLQLLAGGVALTRSSGITDRGCVLEIVKVREDGAFCDSFVASPLVLARAEAEIAGILGDRTDVPAKAGDHCKFCPALGACPETGRAARGVGAGISEGRVSGQGIRPVAESVVWSTEFVSLENDALLVEELAAIKKAIDAIEDGLKRRATAAGGIYLPNGKVYKAIVSSRSGLDKEKVEELLGDRYAECVKVTQYEQFRQVKA